ncbi:MAG: helix-turn-helix domain-containing protein [Candidatus Acidiferrum sp.]|jgi:excisionase family DNA binding protein
MEQKTGFQLHRREVAAQRLGVSLRTLDELIATKQIVSVKVTNGARKGCRRISERAIEQFINRAEKAAR